MENLLSIMEQTGKRIPLFQGQHNIHYGKYLMLMGRKQEALAVWATGSQHAHSLGLHIYEARLLMLISIATDNMALRKQSIELLCESFPKCSLDWALTHVGI